MTLMLLMKGVLLGIVNAAPVGPVGLLCLEKNMAADRWRGLFAGLGMAVAYGIISFCVVFGLKTVSRFLEDHETLFQISGGVLLIFMGWRGLRLPKGIPNADPSSARYLGEFTASFAMTLFNPVPFATFALILTTFRVFDKAPSWSLDLGFAASVAAGTLFFWVVVNEILHHVKKRSPESLSLRVRQGTSFALLAFGLVIAAKGIF